RRRKSSEERDEDAGGADSKELQTTDHGGRKDPQRNGRTKMKERAQQDARSPRLKECQEGVGRFPRARKVGQAAKDGHGEQAGEEQDHKGEGNGAERRARVTARLDSRRARENWKGHIIHQQYRSVYE